MIAPVFNLQPEKLEDNLIKILPLRVHDFERLFAVASDPLIWALHPSKDRYKREVFEGYFKGALDSNSAFLIFDKATNELIGSTRYYDFQPEMSKIAIGFTFLATKYWGGKYNQSMKSLLLDYAFQFVETVFFHIGATNIRSQKAILNIGAKKTEELDIGNIPHYIYEIKKNDWEIHRKSKK